MREEARPPQDERHPAPRAVPRLHGHRGASLSESANFGDDSFWGESFSAIRFAIRFLAAIARRRNQKFRRIAVRATPQFAAPMCPGRGVDNGDMQ
jgi:hypothetical protein